MLRASILLCVLLGLGTPSHATGIPGCPPWANAQKNLKLHNYKISDLSPVGIGHAISYFNGNKSSSRSIVSTGVTGHFAYTTFYQFVAEGKAVGGMPTDKAMVVLYNAQGECIAQVGGTIGKVKAVVDGSASEFSRSVVH